MILSKNELKSLVRPKDIEWEKRGTFRTRARKKIGLLNSKSFKEELLVISKNMQDFDLLEIIDLLTKELPLPLAKPYFAEKNEYLK